MGHPNPRVSLMVPVFNRADLLRPCLDSALAQTMGDLEVVVVDGASTDGTWEVCLEYAAADRRIRAVREKTNTGPVRGWRRCLDEARGACATFLWSDDLLMPTFLERTIPFLADDEIAFAYTGAEIGASPGTGAVRFALPSSRVIESTAFVSRSLTTRRQFPVSPACALFRVEDLRRNLVTELPTTPPVDLTSTGAGVDLMFFLLAASDRPLVAHIAEPLAFFRAHPGSISTEGRGGQVALNYALAKSWFAREHYRSDLVPTILAWHWLGQMRSSRRPNSPVSAVLDYRGLIRPTELLIGAAKLIATLAVEVLPWMGEEHGIPQPVQRRN